MGSRKGSQTVHIDNKISIVETASVVGQKEGKSEFGKYYDTIMDDSLWGEETWEKAESKMQNHVVTLATAKAKENPGNIQYIFAGDLLNQCIGSAFGLREIMTPFFGLFGACSTMGEGLSLASMVIDGGFADTAVACTSSHFCAAERQFRFPLEYGGQRPPTAQWTVTGAGAMVLKKTEQAPFVNYITTGKITDFGVTDANNMGAAMAPVNGIIGKCVLTI